MYGGWVCTPLPTADWRITHNAHRGHWLNMKAVEREQGGVERLVLFILGRKRERHRERESKRERDRDRENEMTLHRVHSAVA